LYSNEWLPVGVEAGHMSVVYSTEQASLVLDLRNVQVGLKVTGCV